MISVTPEAAEQIRAAFQNPEMEGLGLRIAAKENDDGSIEYGLGFDEEREFDFKLESEGFILFISPTSGNLLEGTTLDFVELESGTSMFVFLKPEDNPEGAGGCGNKGCGSGGCA
jgi:iron-sulfur cluster assembly protein